MRPRIAIYVSEEELKQIRREAVRRRLSLSRYLKERLIPADFEEAPYGAAVGRETEKLLVDAVRRAASGGLRHALDQISTLIVMLDQFALRRLGEEHHQHWQHEVEDLLRRLRTEPSEPASAVNGSQA